MTDQPSVTTFVVGDRFPWPVDFADAIVREPLDSCVISAAGSRRDCRIRRISARGVTLVGELTEIQGDHVAIELDTGQRQGTIAWVNRDELGVAFDEPLDMVALLNRKLVSQPAERRTMPRVEIRCDVFVKFAENLCAAVMRNISARGLQLEGADLPPGGTYVSVFVEGMNVPPGEVIWRRGNLAGIELVEELSWSSIIPWIKTVVRKETAA